jgi:MFS family permease
LLAVASPIGRRLTIGAFALLFVDFIDELGSGIPVADAPTIRSQLELDYSGASWFLLTAPLLAAVVLETPLMLLSDRWPRKHMVAVGLAVMALALAVASLATSAWVLAAAFALWAAAGGTGVGVAQAALMAAFPDQRERMMTRWTLMGMLGDATTPVLLVAVAGLGGDWRIAMQLAAALHLFGAMAVAIATIPVPATKDDEDGDDVSIWTRLRQGLTNKPLLLWLGVCSLCCLLDEILVAFGTLYLRDELHATTFEQAGLVLAIAVGGGLGLVVTDRLLHRVSPMKLLAASGFSCALTFAAWLSVSLVPFSLPLAFLVGLTGAPLYPISAAQAYRMLPDRPGVVQAVDQIFAPLPIVAPLLVGWIADEVGLRSALAVLLVQPLVLGLLALVTVRKADRDSGDATTSDSPAPVRDEDGADP